MRQTFSIIGLTVIAVILIAIGYRRLVNTDTAATITDVIPPFEETISASSTERDPNPAFVLAAESRDPVWAPATEGRILQVIGDSVDAPMSLLQAECRTTICGAVVGFPPDVDMESLNDDLRDIRSEVPLPEFYGGNLITGRTWDGLGRTTKQFVVFYWHPPLAQSPTVMPTGESEQ